MNKYLTVSKNANPNYLATVCKIEEVYPIDGKDRIVKTVINGYDMIIPKTMTVGTTVIYIPVESAISEKFLSNNNLYARDEFEKNSNAEDVKKLIEKAESMNNLEDKQTVLDEIKTMCGFFNRYGRVRILKLGGIFSQGFIINTDMIETVYPQLKGYDWESEINNQFDSIDNELFCWKYTPPIKVSQSNDNRHWKQRMKKLKKFDRIIEGTFKYHYDTKQLGEHFNEINPESSVTISVKLHGTSAIFANIPVKRMLSFWEKIKKFFGFKVIETEYDNIYSSRSVIKNQYITNKPSNGYYNTDVWGCVNNVIAQFIPQDWTVYGEIVGYEEGTRKFIQKNHDYGCKEGEWKFMPYRITQKMPDGSTFEWNVNEVRDWTLKLMNEHSEIANRLFPINILYNGIFSQLYPDIPVDENWHKEVLARMKNDKTNFLMELDEPMCRNKVPREGIVIRINNDKYARAWKLKTQRHYAKECEAHDKGEIDMEENA